MTDPIQTGALSKDYGSGSGSLVEAGVALLPFGLSFGAVGAAITGRFPRLAVPVLAALAVLSYFLQEFSQLFSWPASPSQGWRCSGGTWAGRRLR
jgi:hypothetical protein